MNPEQDPNSDNYDQEDSGVDKTPLEDISEDALNKNALEKTNIKPDENFRININNDLYTPLVSKNKKKTLLLTLNSIVTIGSVVVILGILSAIFLLPIVTFIIVGLTFAFFMNYQINNRFLKWSFFEDHIELKPAFKEAINIYYSDITSFQLRYHLPKESLVEYIPETREMCIWVKHKTMYSFDETEYLNFDEMEEYFTSTMAEYGIEPAPYREKA